MPIPNVITIGAEVEYVTKPMTDLHSIINSMDLDELNMELEYYSNMVEFNEILESTSFSEQGIESTLARIRDKIKNKAIELKRLINRKGKRTWRVYISAMPFVRNNGIVFNGIHIHMGYKVNSPGRLKWFKAFAAYWKYKNNWDLRAMTSHHIWGAHRESRYIFKRKPKFSPVIVTSHNTTEFRVFSYEDITYKVLRRKLAKFLYTLTYAHHRYYNRVRFVDYVCDNMGWNIDEIREFWNEMCNTRCEVIPRDFDNNREIGRFVHIEELHNNDYRGRVFVATNVNDTVKVVRRNVNYNIASV